jgi:hypothetical protein
LNQIFPTKGIPYRFRITRSRSRRLVGTVRLSRLLTQPLTPPRTNARRAFALTRSP